MACDGRANVRTTGCDASGSKSLRYDLAREGRCRLLRAGDEWLRSRWQLLSRWECARVTAAFVSVLLLLLLRAGGKEEARGRCLDALVDHKAERFHRLACKDFVDQHVHDGDGLFAAALGLL